jgi:predicted YcjX-like family ATPase
MRRTSALDLDVAAASWVSEVARLVHLSEADQSTLRQLATAFLANADACGIRHAAQLLDNWGYPDIARRLETAIHQRGKA